MPFSFLRPRVATSIRPLTPLRRTAVRKHCLAQISCSTRISRSLFSSSRLVEGNRKLYSKRNFSSSDKMEKDTKIPENPITSMAAPDTENPIRDAYQLAMANNTQWASKVAREQPELFPKLATGQYPEILWIGCADSRCPETTVLGLEPGQVFVHRNIANIVQYNDISSAAVIEFAVMYLQVKHIILCGHTACGGISAALSNKKLGLLDTWLMPLRRLREQNLKALGSMEHKDAAARLAEINVIEGLRVLKENSSVLDAIQDRGLKLHGVIFDVGTGKLRELDSDEPIEAISARLTAFKTLAAE